MILKCEGKIPKYMINKSTKSTFPTLGAINYFS